MGHHNFWGVLTTAYVCLNTTYVLLTYALHFPYVCLTFPLRLLTFAYVLGVLTCPHVVNEHVHSGRNRSENARIWVRIPAYPCVSLRTPYVLHYDNERIGCVCQRIRQSLAYAGPYE